MMMRGFVSRLVGRSRSILFSIGVVVALRLGYAALIYQTLRTDGVFRTPFMSAWSSVLPFDWLYLFSAWDTGYYQMIAFSWYPNFQDPLWAFFPLYPAAARILILGGINNWLACFVVATVAGLLSVPVFLTVAEKYLGPNQAFTATVLYFLLPHVFVFSGVSYSEPVFLLFSLLAWHFHQGQKEFKASVSAALCSLARPYGILIAIPLAYEYIKRREPRKLFYLLIPALALSAWSIYGTVETRVLVPWATAGLYWHTPNANKVWENMGRLAWGDLTAVAPLVPYTREAVGLIASLVLTAYLVILVSRVDKALTVYILVTVFGILIVTKGYPTTYPAFPRFLSVLFPLGLVLHTSNRKLLAVMVVVLLILDYVAWLSFLTDGFH